MPNRVLRDGLIYSGRVNSVGELAEALYVRLVLSADDFGLIEAGPVFVKARCMPARAVTPEDIGERLLELEKAGLIRSYQAGGKLYAAIEKWDQRRFARHPKYPMPPWGMEHIRGGYVDPRVAGDRPAGERARRAPRPRSGPTVDRAFDDFYAAYPKKVARPAAERAWRAAKISNGQVEKVMAALAAHKASDDWLKEGGRFVPHPSTWLNQRRWEDQAGAAQAPQFPV